MKRTTILVLAIGILFSYSRCTHSDESNVEIPPPVIEYGTNTVKMSEGWTFDKTHSNIGWETAYLGSSALLTGRFNSFAIELEFAENKPEQTTVKASVVLSSVNTGEPGRDAGCLLGTFGTDVSDAATFTSTKVDFDGEGGYIVDGTLSFHGKTSPVIMKLKYVGTTYFPEGRNGPYYVAGFSAEFEFLAKSGHDIQSTNIADLVKIKANAQFRKSG